MYQKENNKLLATSLFQIKDKKEVIDKMYQELEDKVKAVAPYIEAVISLP